MSSPVICEDCGKRVSICAVSTESKEEYKKSYGGFVQSKGERVSVRLGLACVCTVYTGHKLRYEGLDSGTFKEKPEKFPENWIKVKDD